MDATDVKAFFEDRARRFDDSHPLVSVLYQDSNPGLAEARDRHEKETLVPLLGLKPTDRVLDIGCGIGRWAERIAPEVAQYHGTDLVSSLVDLARTRFRKYANVSFQTLGAQDHTPEALSCPPPFDLAIVAGVLVYVNDADCFSVLRGLASCCGPSGRVLIREPVGVLDRLTLKGVWSEELRHSYSAIYRTIEEYIALFEKTLLLDGFVLLKQARLLPPGLSNRTETTQHYFLLARDGQ